MFALADLISRVEAIVAAHAVGDTGAYARWLWQDESGSRQLGINEYGCADAANVLYTIGGFPEVGDRPAWVRVLQARQDATGGLFRETTHDPLHTTAHCVAALELFEALPVHPLRALAALATCEGIRGLLDELDWTWNPWGESHKGAGAYAALRLAGEPEPGWEDAYFAWLWEAADPATGLWRRGCIDAGGAAMLFHHLAGSFHYLFNHEYARRPLRYPAAMVDTCLRIEAEGLFAPLGCTVGFAEIDWVYCLHRALRQSGHRFADARSALSRFARRYVDYLCSLDALADDGLNDLHQLFGAVCALAELQQALPGMLRTERPLRLVLDRRPFV
ncbi:hypothetical protein L6Q96_14990 [Candidatus Binatia bacterium]|nr:hypothetical protein [Candidatus Binatia bacterium]